MSTDAAQLKTTALGFNTANTSPRSRCKIERAIEALAGPLGKISGHHEQAWASVTFSGTRHALTIEFAGAEGFDAAKDFSAAVATAELDIAGCIVADAAVRSAAWQLVGDVGARISIEMLVLDVSPHTSFVRAAA